MNIRPILPNKTKTLLLGLAIFLSACAGVPKPTQELASARTAIDVARQAGAPSESTLAFTQAREYLAAAESHLEREEHVKAKRMAEQALAKAEQARAEAELAKTEAAAVEVETGLSVLKEQIK